MTDDLTAKRLEILREIVPKLRRIVTFYDPRNPGAVSSLAAAREAAGKLDIEVAAQQVTSPKRSATVCAPCPPPRQRLSFSSPTSWSPSTRRWSSRRQTPSACPPWRPSSVSSGAGALAGYGPDFREYGRRPARYVARILAGSFPRDLPVEAINQPALAINLKTAKAIGLDIPPLLLTRADEVIE